MIIWPDVGQKMYWWQIKRWRWYWDQQKEGTSKYRQQKIAIQKIISYYYPQDPWDWYIYLHACGFWVLYANIPYHTWILWVYIGSTPHPVTVTSRIITFLVGDPYRPSFPTVTGWGIRSKVYSSGVFASRDTYTTWKVDDATKHVFMMAPYYKIATFWEWRSPFTFTTVYRIYPIASMYGIFTYSTFTINLSQM